MKEKSEIRVLHAIELNGERYVPDGKPLPELKPEVKAALLAAGAIAVDDAEDGRAQGREAEVNGAQANAAALAAAHEEIAAKDAELLALHEQIEQAAAAEAVLRQSLEEAQVRIDALAAKNAELETVAIKAGEKTDAANATTKKK